MNKKKGRLTTEERERLQEHAKYIFLAENVTAKDLAVRVGVDEKTIGKWIEELGWKKFKRNLILTRDEQLALLYDELSEINNFIITQPEGKRFADSKLANTRRYLVKDIKELETDAQLPEIISALTQFLNFVRRNGIDDTKLIAGYVDGFIKSKLK